MNAVQPQQSPAHPVYDIPFNLAILTAITNSSPSDEPKKSIDGVAKTDTADKVLVKPATRVSQKAADERSKLTQKNFHVALLDIYRHGLEYSTASQNICETIAEPMTNAAIPGLAKILGTYRTYFDNAEDAEKASLFKILLQKCRTDFGKYSVIKSDKRTTEWHLLSRMFRRSDRRQASADAKILKFAHAEGITEDSFPAWVKKYKTLSNIIRGILDENPEENKKPKKTTKAKPRYELVDRTNIPETEPQQALDAVKKLADGKAYQIYIFNHQGRFEIVRYKIAARKVLETSAVVTPVAGPNSHVAPAAEKAEETVR